MLNILTVTPIKAQNDIRVKELHTDKAKHVPNSTATITVTIENLTASQWSGDVTMEVYHLENKIYSTTSQTTVGAGSIATTDITWQVPQEDYQGYLVKAYVNEGTYKTTAIDCSSNVERFPRYGYVAEFPTGQSLLTSQDMINALARDYHISAIQFYDWMWRHDEMIKRTNGVMDEAWVDLFGRTLNTNTIKDLIQASNEQHIDSMAYVMSYAGREGYDQFGVDPSWGLYEDMNHQHQLNVDFGNNSTYLWLFNPADTGWQTYITNQYLDAINAMGFSGLQIDQMGQRNNLYNYYGQSVALDGGFSSLINATKTKVGENHPITFNIVDGTVDGWAMEDVTKNGHTDFDFSEIWFKSNSYKAIHDYIQQVKSQQDKALVLAAYMNYRDNTGTKYEAESASLLGVGTNTNHGGYTGTGFVDGFEAQGDKVTFTINATEDGLYPLVFRYGNDIGSNATRNLYVDGVKVATVPFVDQDNWDTWAHDAYYTIALTAGSHTIGLAYDSDNTGAINLDNLTIGEFDKNSIRLTNAAFAASGAYHIELGANEEHTTMLPHEYYASLAKTMRADLRDAMKEHYDFITAYENLLYDPDINYGDSGTQFIDIENEFVNGSGEAGSIYAMYRFKEDYDMIHLINLTGENDNEWRNATGDPIVKYSLKTKYYIGPNKKNVSGVYLATPDRDESMSKSLDYTVGTDEKKGSYVSFTIDRLDYWDMVYVKSTKTNNSPIYEAEKATNSGVSTNTNHVGYTGDGFVDGFGEQNDTVSFNISVDTKKTYNLKLRYANATGTQAVRAIFIDGQFVGKVYMDNLANWDMWGEASIDVALRAGDHQVVVLYGDHEYGAINLDHVEVR